MIAFFRKIRRQLLTTNKFRKYLVYAIGEIFLVVIGILIALQIHNWNNKRIALAQGRTLMTELLEELKDDISTCNWAIENLQASLAENEAIFARRDLRTVSLDSLLFFFTDANLDIRITANTYDKIKALGISNISRDNALNQEVHQYFDKDVVRFNRRISYYWDNQREIWDYLAHQNYFILDSELVQGFDRISRDETTTKLIEFINLPRTRRSIESTYTQNLEALATVERFKKQSIGVLEKIHAELLRSDPDLAPLPDFDRDH